MRVIFNSSPSHPTLLSLFLARLGEYPLQEKIEREHVGLLSVSKIILKCSKRFLDVVIFL